MKYNVFISYASPDQAIVENLRGEFKTIGINAWVYSLDRTIATDSWKEIKEKITESDLVLFVVSENTLKAEGQKRELSMVLEKVTPVSSTGKIMPVFIDETKPSDFPIELSHKNGLFLDASSVKTVALKVAKSAFPSLFEQTTPWKYPRPGEWLKVSNIDRLLEQYFDLGDKLYFRTISPMGLFECYAPKIKELFWISPENISISTDIEDDKLLEDQIPFIFTVMGIVEIQRRGWDLWHRDQEGNND